MLVRSSPWGLSWRPWSRLTVTQVQGLRLRLQAGSLLTLLLPRPAAAAAPPSHCAAPCRAAEPCELDTPVSSVSECLFQAAQVWFSAVSTPGGDHIQFFHSRSRHPARKPCTLSSSARCH